jgi:surface polysaccharide O-acyltransferase-like enzyme
MDTTESGRTGPPVGTLARVRLAGLDNLRLFVVLAVVVLHAAMSYMAYAPEWWYVVDPPGSLFFLLLVLAVDVPIMPILFFLAGYFAWSSIRSQGPRRFVAGKSVRIGLPWVAGVVLLAPPTAYIMLYSRGVDVGLFEFWRGPYWDVFYQQSVYWFLGVLFLLFVVTAGIAALPVGRRWLDREVDLCSDGSRRKRYLALGVFWVATALAFFLVHQRVALDTWHNWNYLLMIQPNRLPLYIGYYFLGLYAGRGRWLHREWLRDERAWPRLATWSAVALVTLTGYLANRILIPAEARTDALVQLTTAILFTATVMAALLFSLALARVVLDHLSPRWARLARASYWIYFLHPLVLYPLVMALRELSWLPAGVKFVVAVVASVGVSWGIAEVVFFLRSRTQVEPEGVRD